MKSMMNDENKNNEIKIHQGLQLDEEPKRMSHKAPQLNWKNISKYQFK